MQIKKINIHGRDRFYVVIDGDYKIPEYNKKKKKWDWIGTIITHNRIKSAREVSIQEILELLNAKN